MNNDITKIDLMKGYANIKKIIDLLMKRNNIKYVSSLGASNDFKEVKEFYKKHNNYLNVFSGGDHGFLERHYNIKFRALHDYMHIKNNLSFSFKDEKKLSEITIRDFVTIAWLNIGVTIFEAYVIKQIINAEIKGQIEYYEKNNKYVDDQKEFILNYLNVS